MGFLDDSESGMDDSCMSCSLMSIGLPSGGLPSYSRRGNNNNSSSNKKGFKFSWDDSGISSVCTEDLEESESSFGGFLSNDRHKRSKNPSPLGKLLEQVDGVGYDSSHNKKKETTLLGGNDSEEEEEEEDLFAPVAAIKKEVVTPEPTPQRVTTIQFVEPLVTNKLEYVQEEDAPLSVWDDQHEAEPHNQIPWDEEDYEELPWHLQPDLEEDDEITKRCKQVIPNPNQEEEEEEEDLPYRRRVDRVEALVICFALTLKNKVLERKSGTGKDSNCSETVATASNSSCSSGW